jgi:hypothetical protein
MASSFGIDSNPHPVFIVYMTAHSFGHNLPI